MMPDTVTCFGLSQSDTPKVRRSGWALATFGCELDSVTVTCSVGRWDSFTV